MALLDTHLMAMFAHPLLTVPVQRGAATFRGIADRAEVVESDQGFDVVARRPTLLVRTADYPNPQVGDALVVNGRAAKVNRHMQEDDGLITRLVLVEGA